MMRVRLLNLEDAFRLASVLSKYVDVKQINPNDDAIGFISKIVEKITPDEYLHCVSLLTNKTEEDTKKEISLDILTSFIEGLKKNRVIALLSFYESLGLNGSSRIGN